MIDINQILSVLIIIWLSFATLIIVVASIALCIFILQFITDNIEKNKGELIMKKPGMLCELDRRLNTYLNDYKDFSGDKFINAVREDLEDKGFTLNEIITILCLSKTESSSIPADIGYKALAYFIMLEHPFDTVEELKTVISNSPYSNYKNYTDDDFNAILDASEDIDY